MKTSFLLTLLPAAATVVLAAPNHYARQDAPPSTVTLSTTAAPPASTTTTPAEELPCPTNPPNCAAKLDGHLICMVGGVWCHYTDEAQHWTPGFYPVNYAGPCPPCLPSW
ncbi:hypothetical protein PG985_011845 [Apiospora marii]|uniref:uncharacterized protein n=1 Tax=Apiospora marii TaxID=335849 RepID=UPI003130C60E